MIDVTHEPAREPVSAQQRSGLQAASRVIVFSILLGLLGLLAWGLIRSRQGQVQSGMAPDFTLRGFNGLDITLSDLHGQVVVINFWASWCPPCREEAAYLEQIWRKYQDRGVVFLGVDYADTDREALAYIAEFDITYHNGPDIGTRISQAYNIQGVPETFYVAKNGELRGVKIGPLSPPELENKLDELLAEMYP